MTDAPAILVRTGEEHDLPALTAIYNHLVEHTVTTIDVEQLTVDQRCERLRRYRHSVATTVSRDPAATGRGLGTYTEVGFEHDRWVDVRWYERPVA